MEFRILVILIFAEIVVGQEPIVYSDCPSEGNKHVDKVEINPCSRQPCAFLNTDNVEMKITFTPEFDEPGMTIILSMVRLEDNLHIFWPATWGDVCKDFEKVRCPFFAGHNYTIDMAFRIPPLVPWGEFLLSCSLEGQYNTFCFRVRMFLAKPHEVTP